MNKRRREENDVESDSHKGPYLSTDANKRADAVSANEVDALMPEGWERDKNAFKASLNTLSRDKVFEILKNPIPQTWLSSAEKTKQEPYKLLYETFVLRFSESSLAKKIVSAQEDSSAPTESLAGKLAFVQCQKWHGKSLDDVFARLNLGQYKNSVSLLKDPALKMWQKYAVEYKGENPYVFLLSRMIKLVDDDKEVAKELVIAKQKGGYKDVIKELKLLLFKVWKSRGKSKFDVFKYLGLEEKGIVGIGSPLWDAWMAYAKFYLESAESKSDDSSITGINTIEALISKISHDQEDMPPKNKKRKNNVVKLDTHKEAKLLESLQQLDQVTILLMIDGLPKQMGDYLALFWIKKWMGDETTLSDIFDTLSKEEVFEILKYPMPTVWLSFAEIETQDSYGLLLNKLIERYGKVKLKQELIAAQLISEAPAKSLASRLDKLLSRS
ncbi:hypothetical protein PsorP6_017154 [Peronosclerospora sorghi]|uniref:Uncharacterized protein n=1 Tax=Peronosclerospora sorghi TaxID=230839 RepID=A0ACC0WDN3_9STRA|nr:hypothetical protein PsorP6_017154 [Peronosclerospora sorghi]